jgi:tetratricopeptide (TPR) repeat protein
MSSSHVVVQPRKRTSTLKTVTAYTLVIVALLIAWPDTASAEWIRLSSDHFVFVGDASERDIRRIARRLEQYRTVVGRLFSDGATASPVPTVVVVFRNDRSFTPFKPVYQGRPVALAGVFSGSEDINYVAVNAEQDNEAYGVVFHEYAHFLTRNALGDPPAWVNEGLADLYQTFDASGDGSSAVIGRPSESTLLLLQSTPTLLPISQLMTVDTTSALYNEGDRRTLFYAQSWALVHYLTFGNPKRAGQLKAYLDAGEERGFGADTFRAAFGSDLAALEREIQGYVRGLTFNTLRLSFDEKISTASTSPAVVISDQEAAGYLGDLMARLNRADEARAYLGKAVDAGDDKARALASLGLIELRAGNDGEAFALLERAAGLAPNVASIQAAYGRALTRRADRGATDSDALYQRARTVLGRALAVEPDNVSTLVTLAEVEMGIGDDPRLAVSLMRRVLRESRSREEYRLMLAQALAMSGEFRTATVELSQLIDRANRADVRDAARRALARVEETRELLGDLAAAHAADLADRAAADSRGSAAQTSTAETKPAVASAEPPRKLLPQGAYVPSLRPVGAGESRVLGTFVAVECRPAAVVLRVDTAAGPVLMAVPGFRDMQFLSYRQDASGSVPCGPQRPVYRVLATFRAGPPVPGADTPNRAVAIELLPDGFTPE